MSDSDDEEEIPLLRRSPSVALSSATEFSPPAPPAKRRKTEATGSLDDFTALHERLSNESGIPLANLRRHRTTTSGIYSLSAAASALDPHGPPQDGSLPPLSAKQASALSPIALRSMPSIDGTVVTENQRVQSVFNAPGTVDFTLGRGGPLRAIPKPDILDLLKAFPEQDKVRRFLAEHGLLGPDVPAETLTSFADAVTKLWEQVDTRYGAEYEQAFQSRVDTIRAHPYYLFTGLVQSFCGGAYTSEFFESSVQTYKQIVQPTLENQRAASLQADKFLKLIERTEKDAIKAQGLHNSIMADTFERAIPSTGIRLDPLINGLAKYFAKLSANPHGRAEIISIHTRMVPNARDLALTSGSTNPPWPSHKYDLAHRSGEDALTAIAYARRLADLEFGLPTSLLEEMAIALRSMDEGVLAYKNRDEVLERKTNLAITGNLIGFVRRLRANFDERTEGELYTAATALFKSNASKIAIQTELAGQYEIASLPRVDELLTGYVPGAFVNMDDLDSPLLYLTRAPANTTVSSDVRSTFKEIEANLLSYGALWNTLQVQINTPEGNTLSTYLTSLPNQYLLDQKDKDLLKALGEKLYTGTPIKDIVGVIVATILPAFEDDNGWNQIRQMNESLRDFIHWLVPSETSAHPETGQDSPTFADKDRLYDDILFKNIGFPIQYHVNAQLTVLYAMMQYEFVHLVVFAVLTRVGERLNQAVSKQTEKKIAQQAKIEKLEEGQQTATSSLSALDWALLPQNRLSIRFPVAISSALTLAWNHIETHSPNDDVRQYLANTNQEDIILESGRHWQYFISLLAQTTGYFVSKSITGGTTIRISSITKHQLDAAATSSRQILQTIAQLKVKRHPATGDYYLGV